MTARGRMMALAALTSAVPVIAADELTGEISLGYREVSVSGDTAAYATDINLDDGPRLFRAAATYRRDVPGGNLPDRVEVELSGLGGDPFEQARLDVRKYGQWHFQAGRRKSDYAYDDILVLPELASIQGSTGGDFHRYDFQRVRDDVSLDVTLSDRASAAIAFERYGRHGESTTTLDVSRDEFELEKPIDEEMELLRGVFRYRWDNATVSFEERLREFSSDSAIFLIGSSEGQNTDDLATLASFFLAQPYELRGHEHVLRVNTQPGDRVELDVAAILGAIDMTTHVDETVRGVAFDGAQLVSDHSGGGSAERDTEVIDVDLSFAVSERLNVTAGVARRVLRQDASMEFTGDGGGASDWDITTTSLEVGVQYAASRELTVAAGVYGDRRDVAVLVESEGSEPVPNAQDTDANGFYASIDYRSGDRFSVRASVNDADYDDPFTLATATSSSRYRLRARYAISDGLALTGSHSRTESLNAPSGWSSDIRQTTLRLVYTAGNWMVAAGASDHDGRRQADRLVVGGFRTDLIPVAWAADTSSADLSVSFTSPDRWRVGGAYRRYDNDGSLDVERDELSLFAGMQLPQGYSLQLRYRDIEYLEGGIEHYDAGIAEIAVGVSF